MRRLFKHHQIVAKLGGILLILLFLKLVMIGTGFYAARHMMGDATAINYAGSERMRSFKMGLLLDSWIESRELGEEAKANILLKEAKEEMARFEEVLYGLRDGSEKYGLPRVLDDDVIAQLNKVIERWERRMKPLLKAIMVAPTTDLSKFLLTQYKEEVYDFVGEIDRAVYLYERYSTWKVKVFDSLQYFFLLLTVLFTITAVYLLFRVIKRPLKKIQKAMDRITSGDFRARVDLPTNDEIGDLAKGFNYMVERLENLYLNLESLVADKTRALRQKNKALSILYQVASSVNTTLPMKELLEELLIKLISLLNAKAGLVRFLDSNRNELKLIAHRGLSETFVREEMSLPLNNCTCGVSIEESRIITIDHCNFCLGPLDRRCKREGFAATVIVPLSCQNKLLGTFNLFFDTPQSFNEEDYELLDSIGKHIGMAVENYQLQTQSLKLAAMEERVLIANELHDSIAQSLAFLKIQGKLLEESLKKGNLDQATKDLEQLLKGVERSNKDVRELLVHFRTRIEPDGLEATLEKYLAKFREETGIETRFEAEQNTPTISEDAEIHVLHIIQEALSNVRKHSGASRVRVAIGGNGCFEALVEDNGRGFDIGAVEKKGFSHIGLDIMKERARRIKGELSVISTPGKGTRVLLRIP